MWKFPEGPSEAVIYVLAKPLLVESAAIEIVTVTVIAPTRPGADLADRQWSITGAGIINPMTVAPLPPHARRLSPP